MQNKPFGQGKHEKSEICNRLHTIIKKKKKKFILLLRYKDIHYSHSSS